MLMKAVDDANRSVNHRDGEQPQRTSHSRTRSAADEKLEEIRSRRKIDATNIDSNLSKRYLISAFRVKQLRFALVSILVSS